VGRKRGDMGREQHGGRGTRVRVEEGVGTEGQVPGITPSGCDTHRGSKRGQ